MTFKNSCNSITIGNRVYIDIGNRIYIDINSFDLGSHILQYCPQS